MLQTLFQGIFMALPFPTALSEPAQAPARARRACQLQPLARASLVVALVAGTWTTAGAAPAASPAAPAPAKAAAQPDAIAWVRASTDAEVDAAFARARAEDKPLFLYWGAKWCPPCNQVQATLFNRHDFIARSRSFVPVYIDGDRPGAQKLGARFRVSGYPTMVLFKSDGTETTRLPGEVDASQYTTVLTLGMNARRPVKAVLADARQGGKGLTANEWRMLAWYSWDTGDREEVARDQVPALLKQLAARCPAGYADASTRLLLQSLAADNGKTPADAATRQRVLRVLNDAEQSRTHMDVLGNQAAEIARSLAPAGSAERTELLARYDASLRRLAQDARLSRADRLTATLARVQLARIDLPAGKPVVLPAALRTELMEQVARDDREIRNGYERQAVITTGAYLLTQAGEVDASDALLQANLARSHSPYYLMSALASNAKARGDSAGALRWYEQAHARSVGPATRLQWGASYVNALIDLAPQDAPRIERAVRQVFEDAAQQPDAFYERSARSLQRVGRRLATWGAGGGAAGDALRRLQTRLDEVCRALPAGDGQRGTCETLLKPAGDAKAV